MHIPFLFVLIIFIVLALAIFLGKSGMTRQSKNIELPYVKKPYLMTNAEREFFKVLHLAVQDKYYIVPQVQLSNIVEVEKGNWHYEYKNKINLKSVDFVLFDKEYFTPHLVIELDDSSHRLPDRMGRDRFVDELLGKVGIKIEHIKNADKYETNELEKILNLT